jgi:hypothetical protein
MKKKRHLLRRPMSCSWWRIPIHSGPLLETNCPHPYFQNPPSPPPTPLAQYYITATTSTILVFLIRNRFYMDKTKHSVKLQSHKRMYRNVSGLKCEIGTSLGYCDVMYYFQQCVQAARTS